MPSQTQIYFDLNTLYTRYELTGTGSGTTVSYYGYSAPGSLDTSTVFSIKKTYYSGNVQYVEWSNNAMGAYESSWNNRVAYFATPSNLGAISAATAYNGSEYSVNFSWISSTGSSRYIALVSEGNRYITNLSDAGNILVNPNNNSYNIFLVNQTSLGLNRCRTGYTYSISLYSYNSAGISNTVTKNVSL